jgi:hypothetical protein
MQHAHARAWLHSQGTAKRTVTRIVALFVVQVAVMTVTSVAAVIWAVEILSLTLNCFKGSSKAVFSKGMTGQMYPSVFLSRHLSSTASSCVVLWPWKRSED